jgi:hypothetical protein
MARRTTNLSVGLVYLCLLLPLAIGAPLRSDSLFSESTASTFLVPSGAIGDELVLTRFNAAADSWEPVSRKVVRVGAPALSMDEWGQVRSAVTLDCTDLAGGQAGERTDSGRGSNQGSSGP